MIKFHAPIYSINRLRVGIDGPGIRTLIGFQGCLLDCEYCINKNSKKIININSMTVEKLIEYVSIDNIYFQSTNGGITFGGGEPLLFPEFICVFIEDAPKEWNYCIETSLNVNWENIELIYDKIDKFIVDIKSIDPIIYELYTSKSNERVISNLIKLKDLIGPEKIMVRVPYIDGYTTMDDCNTSIEYLKEMGITNIDFFKYKIKQHQ